MANQDGVTSYGQTTSFPQPLIPQPPPPPPLGSGAIGTPATSSSTKVMNLSRAQINLNQPEHANEPVSPSVLQPGAGQIQQQTFQSPQTYYAQPASKQPLNQWSPQQQGYGQYNHQPQHQQQDYITIQRTGQNQPQLFTVGSTIQGSPQVSPQYHQHPQTQPQQQFRAYATPAQSTEPTRIVSYAVNQPPSQANYIVQPTPQPMMQYQSNSQPQQNYQQVKPYQQESINQPTRQQQEQFQQPEQYRIIQPAVQSISSPYIVQPQNVNTTMALHQAQPIDQMGSSGMNAIYLATNQQTTGTQPISIQSGQQWSASSPQQISGHTYQWQQQVEAGAHQQVAPQVSYLPTSRIQPTSTTQPQQQSVAYQQQPNQQSAQTVIFPQTYSQPVQNQPCQSQQLARPPVSPTHPISQQEVRRRLPSAGGVSTVRTIKVKSLPMRYSASIDGVDSIGPPQFVQHPIGQLSVNEGDSVNVTTRVRPAGDSSLQVEWYKNGKPLTAASRFTTTFDRGYAVLDFLYTNVEDSGEYSCVASNSQGQDQSSGCRLTILPEDSVITETQLPEESMVANLAAMENQIYQNGLAREARYRDEPHNTNPPSFLKPLSPQLEITEGSLAHFETVVEPSNDASLTIDWFKDGSAVSMGCRFNAAFDRGFAVLDIHYCYPEDNGAYFCVARNNAGQVQSNVVELRCNAAEKIVTSSLLSKESVFYLQSLDNWGSEQMAGYDNIHVGEEQNPSAPSFDILPIALTVTEGSPARFLVKASGYPSPKVQWYIDDERLASTGGGGNWRVFQDGGISYLEFHRVGTACQHRVRALARNNLGEVTTETTLVIEPQLDFRPDLYHVEPENPFKKLAQLKHVDRSSELKTAFQKPKPQALALRKLERASEHKGRSAVDAEAIEVENMYARVHSQLRTNRRFSLPPPKRTEQTIQQRVAPQPQQQQSKPAPPTSLPQQPQPEMHPAQSSIQILPNAALQSTPPATEALILPPPAPPTASEPVTLATMGGQLMNSPTEVAQSEYLHDEVSADFTIQL